MGLSFLSPAFMRIVILLIAAIGGNVAAIIQLRALDKNLAEILAPFDKEDYLLAAEKFTTSLES